MVVGGGGTVGSGEARGRGEILNSGGCGRVGEAQEGLLARLAPAPTHRQHNHAHEQLGGERKRKEDESERRMSRDNLRREEEEQEEGDERKNEK